MPEKIFTSDYGPARQKLARDDAEPEDIVKRKKTMFHQRVLLRAANPALRNWNSAGWRLATADDQSAQQYHKS